MRSKAEDEAVAVDVDVDADGAADVVAAMMWMLGRRMCLARGSGSPRNLPNARPARAANWMMSSEGE
jgi:hypothetical protein